MKKYKISEIANMFNITRTALIHYDKYDLLSPSIRNEKNYRYYTTDDIKKLELIIALKESGLSLNEIKSYLHEKNNKSSIELLTHQKLEIDTKIQELINQRNIIEKKIEHLKRFSAIDIYEGILLEDYPEMKLVTEPIGFGPLLNYSSAVNRLKNKLTSDGQLSSKYGICYDINTINHLEKYDKKFVFDYLSNTLKSEDYILIPQSKYFRCIHKGKQESIHNTINEIIDYAISHNYVPLGVAYYVPLFDYWESMSEEFIGEVLLPVKKHLNDIIT